jgi:hypothetical protein
MDYKNEIVLTESLNYNPKNPKKNYKSDPEAIVQYSKLIKDLKTFGQQDPIDVRIDPKDKKMHIVNGNHRYFAMIELGIKECAIKNYGEKTFTQCIHLLTKDKTYIPFDEIKEAEMLKELDQLIKESLPYTESELKEMEELLKFDFDNYETTDVPVIDIPNEELRTKFEARGFRVFTCQTKDDYNEIVKFFEKGKKLDTSKLLTLIRKD